MKEILQTLEEMTMKQLTGCILRSESGIPLYTPDGEGNYHALWTRDFTYMLEYAGELVPVQDAIAGIEYLLAGQREDGWIPDRVDQYTHVDYTAGDGSFGLPNLDNAAFLILAVDCTLRRLPEEESRSLFLGWAEKLARGLAALPLDENGMIYNDPVNPHSPYGFTDCIGKTGSLLMESLLLWRALRVMETRYAACSLPKKNFAAHAGLIEANLEKIFADKNSPMLLAATADCRQIDIWGSCYAISVDFPLSAERRSGIAQWLLDNAAQITEAGQIRHTAPGENWQRLLLPVECGEYQNGAYWAVASGWYMDAVKSVSPAAAKQILEDAYRYFQMYGIYECVNGDYRKLPNYVASITNLYGAAKKFEEIL